MKRILLSSTRTWSIWPMLALLTLTGCANLSAIREFADTSAESVHYTALVNDYVAYPDRQLRYAPANQRAIYEQMKVKRLAQQDTLLARVALIQEYMSALGHLAADSVVNFDSEIDGLNNAITSNQFASTEEVEAVNQIAKLLLRVAANAWRQRQLKQLIEEANAPFQIVIDAQKKIVMQGFGGDVSDERVAADKFYSTLIRRSSDPAGIAAAQEWWELRQAEIVIRGEAVEAYVLVLGNIGKGHQQLYDGRNDLTKRAMIDQIRKTTRDLKKLIGLIRNM